MKSLILFFSLLLISNTWAQIFISPDGDNNNPGTIDLQGLHLT